MTVYRKGTGLMDTDLERRRQVLKLFNEGFSYRQIESITKTSHVTVYRFLRGRTRPEPTPSVFSTAPQELKRDLDRALRNFEMGQTPSNWNALQDARRAYEDYEFERKRVALHR